MKAIPILMAALALPLSGCVIRAHVPHGVVVVDTPAVEYGYEPILYDGYVVYFTDDGIPFYWVNGVQVWVPAHERHLYISHWRAHRAAYFEWYRHRGNHYRTIRYRHSPPPPAIRPHNDGPRIRPHDDDPQIRPHDRRPDIRPHDERRGDPMPRIRPHDDDRDEDEDDDGEDEDGSRRRPRIRPH